MRDSRTSTAASNWEAGPPRDAGDPQESLVVPRATLEQLQRMASVGAVASSVSHEFNNILTTILNQAKMGLLSRDNEARERSFDKILQSARRAAKITTGVLALSRNRACKRELVDVAVLVDQILAVVEKDLVNHRVQIQRDFQPCPPVELVASQIEQVLMNLVINARQAMAKGGVLRVGVQLNAQTDFVEIRVQDTGSGIEPRHLSKIFDPFFSTKDGPDDAGQGGSGLGLPICREIIERHEGRIRVESLLGRGTTFTVKLPARLAPRHAA